MILVATPTRGEVLATFTYDLTQLLKQSPDSVWGFSSGSYIPNNRLRLVRKAVESGFSHILFIDSDMRFPSDTIERLVRANKDIVGAICRQRTANKSNATKNGKHLKLGESTGLEEVDSLGTGVMLINLEVFKKLPEPWFAMPYDMKDGHLVGEDQYFCTVAREQGFKIWIDHDLSKEVKHTGTVELGVI